MDHGLCLVATIIVEVCWRWQSKLLDRTIKGAHPECARTPMVEQPTPALHWCKVGYKASVKMRHERCALKQQATLLDQTVKGAYHE